jgi:hypothetical protein
VRRASLSPLLVALALLAGCDGSAEETSTGDPAEQGKTSSRELRSAWAREPACRRPPGASRWGCSVGAYRCHGVVTGRGWSISCAKPGRSIAFTVPRG